MPVTLGCNTVDGLTCRVKWDAANTQSIDWVACDENWKLHMGLREKLSKLLRRTHKNNSRGNGCNHRRRLMHEQMEDRRLMAVIDLATLTSAQGTKFFVNPDLGTAIGDFTDASSAGDVNGDGYEDLLFSANGAEGEGRVFLIYGRAVMPATLDLANLGSAGISIKGNNVYHGIGISLSGAGDVNGDGFDDFVIGAKNGLSTYQNIHEKGESYLIFGGNTLPATLDLNTLGNRGVVFLSSTVLDRGGWAVSGAGDVNGDGFNDLIVGSPSYGSSKVYFKSGAYVIYGRTDFPQSMPLGSGEVSILRETEPTVNATGFSVSSAGDVNGDGFDDMIIGAPLSDGATIPRTDSGASYLVFGGPALPAVLSLASLGTRGVKIIGADVGDQMGRSVSNAGDVNGDGYADLVIGAAYGDAANNLKSNAGDSYVIFGRAAFPAVIDLRTLGAGGMTLFGVDPDDFSGYRVSGAGDVNSDGFDDILIGAPGADGLGNNRPFAGESYVIFGRELLPASLNLASLGDAGIKVIGAPVFPGSTLNTGIGESDAGDVNGDGFDDFIVGSNVILGGNNFTFSVNRLGTPNPQTLTGSSAADYMVGGRGDDVLIGRGGPDVLIGGQGNDVLAFKTLDFRRLDGGTGSNTLRFDGSDLSLKLSDPRLSVFDTVDLTGTGNNLLVVKVVDILRTRNDTLVVRGNAGDRVNYGTGWVQGANELINGVSYYVFSQGTATLKVQVGVTVNQAPLITNFRSYVTASQDGPAVILDDDVKVTDVDSPNFAGGILTIDITVNAEVPDRIEIKNTGNAAGQIGITGNTIKYGNQIIGTFSGTTTLTVTLNGNATPKGVTALLRNVTFRTTAISTAGRRIEISLTDGDGARSNVVSKGVLVTASNVPPTLVGYEGNIGLDLTFASSVLVAPSAIVIDPDSNFDRGSIGLTILGGQPEDYFTVASDTLGVIQSIIGGQGPFPLGVNFNNSANSTAAAVQAVLRGISFGTNSPVEGNRTLLATISDGDGGYTNLHMKTVNVVRTKIPPVISSVSAGIDYYTRGVFQQLTPNAALSVGRLSDFTNSTLVYSVSQNGDPSDVISIRNVDPSAGNNILSNGMIIGTFSGGTGLTPLVVTFNANATQASVQAVMRAVNWKTQATTPAKSSRTISVSLTLEGLTSSPQSVPIRISYAPEVLNLGPSVAYGIAGPEVRVAVNATISGAATRSFASGNVKFAMTQNGEATDVFAIRNEGVGNSQIGVSGSFITYEGVVIGTFSGGLGLTPLIVTFNAAANRESVQKLIRTVTYKSTIAVPSLNPRTFGITLTDGLGLEGSPATEQIILS